MSISSSVPPAWLRDGVTPGLSPEETAMVDAIFARIWPADHARQIPGARDVQAARYVSLLLGRDADTYWEIPQWRTLYATTLEALNGYARQQHGKPLVELDDDQMNALLKGLEAGTLTGLPPVGGTALDQAGAFKTLRRHCIQGCVSDPRWGGNAERRMWRALGYIQPPEDLSREHAG